MQTAQTDREHEETEINSKFLGTLACYFGRNLFKGDLACGVNPPARERRKSTASKQPKTEKHEPHVCGSVKLNVMLPYLHGR
jgi:hypothetical protein